MSERAADPHADPRVVRIMDLEIHDVDFDETVARTTSALAAGRSFVVATPNVDYVVRAHRDPVFRDAINAADLRVPDGMWIVRASRIAGVPLRATVTGRLLIPALASFAANSGIPIALVGGPPGVADRAAARLAARFPRLRIALATAPPMGFVISSDTDSRLVEQIAASGARLVLVALGAPRQERWMAEHRDELDGRVLVGIGAGLDIVAGRFREAPSWMTRTGLEWAFRLAQEPRRLARRYLVDDPVIFAWALRQRIRSRS
jgi:N-acetylglucosaminyldiphosphoundecaprenol N-acetyl-beta-D-mannosaminyltransferase